MIHINIPTKCTKCSDGSDFTNFTLNPKSVSFHTTTTDFLGYVVTPNGISMDEVKTKAIQDWPEPRKVRDIQSFLGFANFYRRFIHNYSDIVIPLHATHSKKHQMGV